MRAFLQILIVREGGGAMETSEMGEGIIVDSCVLQSGR